jgi:F-type H+-transporting ATPase subunit delta
MSAELIAKKYAKVLIELESEKELKGSLDALKALSATLSEPKVKDIISSPLVSNAQKFELFIKPLEKKLDKNLYKLLELMSQKGRLGIIPMLLDIVSSELKKRANRYQGVVEADKKLSKDDIKKLQNILKKHSGADIELKQINSKSDGLKVKVDELGLELNYSKSRLKSELLEYIQKAL